MENRWVILAVLFTVRTVMGIQFQSVASVSPFLIPDLNMTSKVMKPLHSVKTDIMEILYRQANLASSKEMPTAYITFTDSGQSLPVMTSYISFAVSSKTRL